MNKPTILILGEGRHGKDEAAEYWRDNFGLTFQSSSRAAAEIFIFDSLKNIFEYDTVDDCFNDRHNHRKRWFDMIASYNTPDETRLAKEIVAKTGGYVGMRRVEEVTACDEEKIFDLKIWIDASERVEAESNESCTVTKANADIIVQNNGTLEQFHEKLHKLGKILFK